MEQAFTPNIPIYIQIIEEVKRRIVSGAVQPGERMGSVRDLAGEFGVNPNTMQKALAKLEEEALLYSERTSGRFITGDTELIEKVRAELARARVAEFLKQMSKLGYTREEIAEFLIKI